jgi:DNA-binding IclR family transcriptional regulator
MAKTATNQSGEKILDVLNVLLRHFTVGLTPTELTKATGLSASNITRYINTLESKGFAERIPDTGRIRASHKVAQMAVNIMRELQLAESKIQESIKRITTEAS